MSQLLRRALMLTLMLVAVSITVAASRSASIADARSSAGIDRIERDVINRLNHYRHAHGLRGVRLDGRMSAGADSHSRSMARSGYFAHGSSWDSRARHYSHANSVGEIIGYTRHTSPHRQPHVMMSAWDHSGPHRSVMLTRHFTRAGIGRARRGDTVYFTVDFAGR